MKRGCDAWISHLHVYIRMITKPNKLMHWLCTDSFAIRGTFQYMMTSSNGNIFRVTGPLCGEFSYHRWIPLAKACDSELWYFPWSAPWINGWVNNRDAGNLRRHRAHYDVNVMQVINSRTSKTGPMSENDKYSLLMHCIKIKSPAKFLLNEQFVFVGGNISFLCVLSCSSEEA